VVLDAFVSLSVTFSRILSGIGKIGKHAVMHASNSAQMSGVVVVVVVVVVVGQDRGNNT
jgi:hypothetical protein